MEHRGDVSDQATAAEERANALALAVQRQRGIITKPAHFNGKDCADCEGEIPQGRLALGYCHCVECQAAKEKVQKLRK